MRGRHTSPQPWLYTCQSYDQCHHCYILFLKEQSKNFLNDDEIAYQNNDNSYKDNDNNMSRDARNTVFGVSDQVRHKPSCLATEDGSRLEISYLRSRVVVLAM